MQELFTMHARTTGLIAALLCLLSATDAMAVPVYLNSSNIMAAVGAATSPGRFNNSFANGATAVKAIDAATAGAYEAHDESTHLWFTAAQPGGGLELMFDLSNEYDIHTLHFWNHADESLDVDEIRFSFYASSGAATGSLSVTPSLGNSLGTRAQDITLAAPHNVRYVTAFLTGTNQQVDFQNIGFTAEVSRPIPEPGTGVLLALGLLGAVLRRRRGH
jgi:PEP-CTERM motif